MARLGATRIVPGTVGAAPVLYPVRLPQIGGPADYASAAQGERWAVGAAALAVATGSQTAATFVTANVLYAQPIAWAGGTVEEIGARFGAGAAGLRMRLGIYRSRSSLDLFPGPLVVDAGEIAIDGATVYRGLPVSAYLQPSYVYYVGLVLEGTAGVVGYFFEKAGGYVWRGTTDPGTGAFALQNLIQVVLGGYPAALPATFPTPVSLTQVNWLPMVWLKFAD